MNRLDGKVALISGAARGIGAETARLMVKAGAWVAVADVLDERGRETVRALEGAGGEALHVHLDVTREEDWTAAIAAVTGHFGGLDILVNEPARWQSRIDFRSGAGDRRGDRAADGPGHKRNHSLPSLRALPKAWASSCGVCGVIAAPPASRVPG